MSNFGRLAALTVLMLWFAMVAVPAHAQWREKPMTGSQPELLPDRTIMAGQSGLGPLMTAELVNPSANARQHKAVIKAQVDGVELVDPAQSNYAPRLDQGHLEYRLDAGEAVQSTSTTAQFDNLSRGDHRIQVALVGNDNKPVGEETTLKVHVP